VIILQYKRRYIKYLGLPQYHLHEPNTHQTTLTCPPLLRPYRPCPAPHHHLHHFLVLDLPLQALLLHSHPHFHLHRDPWEGEAGNSPVGCCSQRRGRRTSSAVWCVLCGGVKNLSRFAKYGSYACPEHTALITTQNKNRADNSTTQTTSNQHIIPRYLHRRPRCSWSRLRCR